MRKTFSAIRLNLERMRYLLLSDIHAYVEALERVLAHAQHQVWDALISLGDTVGYGVAPNATLDLLRALSPYAALRGNHEAVLLEAFSGVQSRPLAPNYRRTSAQSAELSAVNRSFVEAMTMSHLDKGWGAVHGALRERWEYLVSVPVARANGPYMERPLYFVGHTHIPGIFARNVTEPRWYSLVCRSERLSFTLESGQVAFINPGSVGQPRDNLGPSYAIYDDTLKQVDIFRLPL